MKGPGREEWLPAIAAVFVTSLVVSNIIAAKLFSIGPVILPAGIIIFPVSYIFGDVLTEVYGYSRARQVIWIGFACNLAAVLAIVASIHLPPAPIWRFPRSGVDAQEAYSATLGFAPRLLAASFVAYLVGEFLNSFVLAKMKIATRGRFLWTRTIGSTVVGQLADSSIFIAIAFAGVIPASSIAGVIASQWLVKSAYEAAATPLTYAAVNFLKKREGKDHFDYGTDFSPLRFSEKSGE